MKLWTIHIQIGIPEAIGSNVLNLIKDVPNFVKDVPRVQKLLSEVGISPQSLSHGFLNEIMDHPYSDGGPRSNRIGCTKFCE